MIFSNIIGNYFRWHYGKAFGELFHLWLNFLWFVIHLFSIKELFFALFAPWRRMTEQKKKGFDFENILAYIIVNLLSRVIGFIMRASVLVVGLICLTFTIVIGALTFVTWIFLPAISIATIVTGVALLSSNLFI